ncbi:MAG: terpene cyclase/mutase family protein [Actinobacteria bacterium]|nr:terpene cyclase/mutase family protein [Actinomycetota bacterium]
MSDIIIEWLLQEDNPSVRYSTLTTLLGNAENDPIVLKVRKSIMDKGVVPEILARQNDDGSWGTPNRFYLDKYTGASWTLLVLAELAADPADNRIAKACEFILSHSRNPECGAFSHKESAQSHTGLTGGVIPCLTGNMVYSLIRLGYLDDERIQKAIEWICTYQRADDGIEELPSGEIHKRYSTGCWGRHSCHMGVAKAFKALASIPQDKRDDAVASKLLEFSEYFLKHHIYKSSHNLANIPKPGWLKFGFPLMYQTDALELLTIFADLHIHDSRLKDAIEQVVNKRLEEGYWNMENSYNGKMLVDIEKKGAPSKWITLNARRVLKEYR